MRRGADFGSTSSLVQLPLLLFSTTSVVRVHPAEAAGMRGRRHRRDDLVEVRREEPVMTIRFVQATENMLDFGLDHLLGNEAQSDNQLSNFVRVGVLVEPVQLDLVAHELARHVGGSELNAGCDCIRQEVGEHAVGIEFGATFARVGLQRLACGHGLRRHRHGSTIGVEDERLAVLTFFDVRQTGRNLALDQVLMVERHNHFGRMRGKNPHLELTARHTNQVATALEFGSHHRAFRIRGVEELHRNTVFGSHVDSSLCE